MQATHGVEIVTQARELAGCLDAANDPRRVEDFAQFINEYGYARVKKAAAKLAGMNPANPYRTIRYLVGILRTKDR
jgi:hypothetical protein